jgi:hypothetical protein
MAAGKMAKMDGCLKTLDSRREWSEVNASRRKLFDRAGKKIGREQVPGCIKGQADGVVQARRGENSQRLA